MLEKGCSVPAPSLVGGAPSAASPSLPGEQLRPQAGGQPPPRSAVRTAPGAGSRPPRYSRIQHYLKSTSNTKRQSPIYDSKKKQLIVKIFKTSFHFSLF